MSELKISPYLSSNISTKNNKHNSSVTSNPILSNDLTSFTGNEKKAKKANIFKRFQLFLMSAILSFNAAACSQPADKNATNTQPEISQVETMQESNEDDFTESYSPQWDDNEDQTQSDENNSTLEDHIHAATVITTPHETIRYVYIPRGENENGENKPEIELSDSDTLSSVIKNNFAEINDDNIYPIALDQAKANSELVLRAVNAYDKSQTYYDVADIPAEILLNAPLNENNESDTLKLVISSHEDFAQSSDEISMTTFA